jgi:hypothetical protein
MNLPKLLFISILILFCSCKKKTSIKTQVFNYALGEPIANATIVIVERHQNGWTNTSCREIASATTDSNGECEFDKEKLRRRGSYDYFLAIGNAYGQPQSYPCGGKTSGFLEVGKNNEQNLNASYFDAFFKVQYNNLLNPSQPGDSLNIYITSPKFSVPGEPFPFGGGGAFGAFPYYGCNGFPFPAVFTTASTKTNAGKHIMTIYKKKVGVISTSVDTVKIYPYETKTIEINW